MKLNELQKAALVALLWDVLKRDPDHRDRRTLGAGYHTKTQTGLCATIEHILTNHETPEQRGTR
jgi:hypothetical protein